MMENHPSNRDIEDVSTRPQFSRKRSNSVPLVEALGCSSAEASLILAEGTAAIRRRQGGRDGRISRRRHRSLSSHTPRESFLMKPDDVPRDVPSHKRTSSEQTIESNSTITGPGPRSAPLSPTSQDNTPLGDYSANLSKFIQSQLNTISSYRSTPPITLPRSCPNLGQVLRSGSQSPVRPLNPPVDRPHIIDIPAPRPPLRSAFSAWSSADESGNDTDGDVPALPTFSQGRQASKSSIYTYSTMLNYYENSTPGSFLFPSTPAESGSIFTSEDRAEPPRSVPEKTKFEPQSPRPSIPRSTPGSYLDPKLTSSSFTSVGSYFDRRPLSLDPEIKQKIIAAVSPYERNSRIINAISPFEGSAITRVHDIFVKSPKQVVIEGMSFEMLRDVQMPTHAPGHVTTPC